MRVSNAQPGRVREEPCCDVSDRAWALLHVCNDVIHAFQCTSVCRLCASYLSNNLLLALRFNLAQINSRNTLANTCTHHQHTCGCTACIRLYHRGDLIQIKRSTLNWAAHAHAHSVGADPIARRCAAIFITRMRARVRGHRLCSCVLCACYVTSARARAGGTK